MALSEEIAMRLIAMLVGLLILLMLAVLGPDPGAVAPPAVGSSSTSVCASGGRLPLEFAATLWRCIILCGHMSELGPGLR